MIENLKRHRESRYSIAIAIESSALLKMTENVSYCIMHIKIINSFQHGYVFLNSHNSGQKQDKKLM